MSVGLFFFVLVFVTAWGFFIGVSEQMVLGATVNAEGLALSLSAVTTPISTTLRRRRGRPRKFGTPSRAVTLTLPEHVIESLSVLDSDLSRAIVALAKRRSPAGGRPPAELAVFGRRAVITIRPTRSLEQRTGIHLVPLPDGRALISFDQPRTIADLELLLFDALDDPKLDQEDRKVFEGIGDILRRARRSNDVVSATAASSCSNPRTRGPGQPRDRPRTRYAEPGAGVY